MPRLLFLIVPLLAACEMVERDGITYTISITSDVPFRALQFSTVGPELAAPAILTPQLLATGVRPVTTRFLNPTFSFDDDKTIRLDDSETDYSWDTWTIAGPGFEHAIAIGSEGGDVVSVSAVSAFVRGDGDTTMTLAMSSRNSVETWGPTGQCERLVLDDVTYYSVISTDRDCDGTPDAFDRNPLAWCRSIPTTDDERAACRSPIDPGLAGPATI